MTFHFWDNILSLSFQKHWPIVRKSFSGNISNVAEFGRNEPCGPVSIPIFHFLMSTLSLSRQINAFEIYKNNSHADSWIMSKPWSNRKRRKKAKTASRFFETLWQSHDQKRYLSVREYLHVIFQNNFLYDQDFLLQVDGGATKNCVLFDRACSD